MESDIKSIKLFTAAKQLNIGTGTIVDFLATKGYKVQKHPMAILESDMYHALLKEFAVDKIIKEEARQISIGKIRKDDSVPEETNDDEYAKRLIELTIKSKDTYLDLGKCNLSSNHFAAGTVLDKELRRCSHLETLILSNEWWTWGGQDKSWIKVESVNNGKRNVFSQIPAAVSHLKNLSKLICCGEMNMPWGIKNINAITNLQKLKYLDLRDNKIESLGSLKKMTSLKSLFVNRNKITSINPLFILRDLSHIDIHTNHIATIEGISKMESLTILDIHNNRIKKISDLVSLKNLKELYIQENELIEIDELLPLLEKEDSFYLQIHYNPFVKDYQLKLSTNENHLPFVKNVLNRIQDRSRRTGFAYPVKVLVFGNHSTGKSSLVNLMTRQDSDGSTHILRIVNYYMDETSRKILPDAIFFDFGGQDFYHGVYRAFVSDDALQLILFEPQSDSNKMGIDNNNIPIIHFNRRYWLGQKSYQENHKDTISRYVIVQTFAETKAKEGLSIDYSKYPGYDRSFFLSLKPDLTEIDTYETQFYNLGKKYFTAYLDHLVKDLQVVGNEPNWYVDFLHYIFDQNGKTHAPVNINDVLKYYKAPDFSEKDFKNTLITLHRHGLVLYYDKIIGLEDIIWLSPQKLVEFIQKEILNKTFVDGSKYSSPGIINKNEFEKIIKDEKISLLLQSQNVIFLHKPTDFSADDEYIVPNFLPLIDKNNSDLQLFTFGFDRPNFVLKFDDYIPFGFINQMICFYGKQPDVKKFWRNQLLFTLDKVIRVLIEVDFEALKINVNFQKLQKFVCDDIYITEYIFFSIMALYWNFSNSEILNFNEFVDYKNGEVKDEGHFNAKVYKWETLKTDSIFAPEDAYISLDGQNYVNYLELFTLNEEEYKIKSYNIANKVIDIYNSAEVPINLFKAFIIRKVPNMKKIFVSYSKFDEEYLQDFEDHLVTLKQEGLATFNCRKIEFGKEWDYEIKKELDECDIMVCLISVKFLNTDYITRIEIPKAIEQNKMIIPIIIKACDWENSPIGKYQAALRGKIVSLDNDKKLLGQISGKSREERDAFWTDIIKEFRTKISF